jgi:histidine decarboxylase
MRPLKDLHQIDRQRLDDLYLKLVEKQRTYIGYPNNQLLDNENLSRFLNLTINNVGDPFLGNNGLHTCDLETEVLDFFASLLHIESSSYWGYVTNGGTEGNIYGLYLGRELYPNGIVYYSAESHYSVAKAVRLLNAKSALIRSQPSGEMDYANFTEIVSGFRHYPVIVNANIGTTMKGAIDNVEKILSILADLEIKDYYIHCDAALFGTMLPFMQDSPNFDFKLPIGSVAVSGHKFLGSPIPCGVVLTRKDLMARISNRVEYIGSRDSTLSGSRDGFTVLVLWQNIKRHGYEGLRHLVTDCMKITQDALAQLKRIDWPCWVNDHSNIIVIRRPSDLIIRKWQLATQGGESHLIVMPGITAPLIQDFVDDLIDSRRDPQKWSQNEFG